MRLASALLAALVIVWSALVGMSAQQAGVASPQRGPSPAALAAPPPATDYLGSASCQRCHEAEQQQWATSLHVKMTKPVAEAAIVGDFSNGTRFADHGRAYQLGRARDGRPFVTIRFGDRPPETFAVDYTLGAKRYQGYLSTLPDGRIYVLPIFWHVEHRRWMDWKEITPIPDQAHDLRQIWNANCFNCHATNLAQGFDVAAKRYDSTWTEMGIGCEACHGPGRAHAELMEVWEKTPSLKPAYDPMARETSDLLKVLSTRSADPRRTFDTCAYCHGNKTNLFVGFKAGERYEDYALPFLPSGDIPTNDAQGEFWPDGRPNRFNRNQALTLSGCFKAGAVTCTSCHVAHGSPNEHSLKWDIYNGRSGDNLCTQCHASSPEGAAAPPDVAPFTGQRLSAHTFHEPESVGSRCVSCHMSDVNWRLLTRRRDHTFQAPAPELTTRYGVPNACTTCHDDKTPEWASAQMDAWWGPADRERRQRVLALADTMYRAGSGDTTVVPSLMGVAVDRSYGAVLRASAAEYIAKMLLGGDSGGSSAPSQTSFVTDSAASAAVPAGRVSATPALINTLIGAASDAEPMVRAAAVKALAATGQTTRVLPAMTARLIDAARVVRVRAAEGLLALGVAELPGAAGAALRRAQDDYAESLRAFPDVAANHAALGWLEASRGRLDAAQRALDNAIQVDDRAPRAFVVKGILAARAERFDEAIDWWKQARQRSPSDPAIATLIAEAEKRKAGAR